MKIMRKLSLSLTALLIALVLQACVKTTPAPTAYAGKWEGADGTTISISADGHGDFKSGNSSVSGGAATIDENAKSLEIKLLGISKTWTIDEPPHETGGRTEMKLSGMVFRRVAGFTQGTTGDTAGKPAMPTEAELTKMTNETLLDFDAAVQAKDFTAFHSHIAKVWQDQTNPAELKKIFNVFIEKELTMASGLKNSKPVFNPPAKINENGQLLVNGYYPTKPLRINFELTYVPQDGAWKLAGINVQVKKAPA